MKTGVKTDKPSYGLGQPVRITFVIENRTRRDMKLRFPSGQKHDMWVQKDGKEVWRWSHDKAFTQMIATLTLAPGEKKVFEQTWKQLSNDGDQVPPGGCDVYAQLMTMPPRPLPVKARITIGRSAPRVTPSTIGRVVENIGEERET